MGVVREAVQRKEVHSITSSELLKILEGSETISPTRMFFAFRRGAVVTMEVKSEGKAKARRKSFLTMHRHRVILRSFSQEVCVLTFMLERCSCGSTFYSFPSSPNNSSTSESPVVDGCHPRGPCSACHSDSGFASSSLPCLYRRVLFLPLLRP